MPARQGRAGSAAGSADDAAAFERARLMVDRGMGAEAAELLAPLAQRNRDNANVWIMLALAELQVFDLERALGHVRKALSLRPAFGPYHYELARILMSKGDLEAADAAIEEAARLGVGQEHLASLRAESLRLRGRFEEARRAIEPALAHDQPPPRTSRTFAQLCSRLETPEEAEAFTRRLLEREGDPQRRSAYFFDLALTFDRAGRHGEAFDAASEAHAQRRREHDSGALGRAIDALIDAWTPEAVARIGDSGLEAETPVFVVGMPRSGSTLLETILSSHPRIEGLGEIEAVWLALPEVDGRGLYESQPVTDLSRVKRSGLKRMGQAFLRRAVEAAPDAARVVDKNLLNWMHVGAIALALPRARFIRCQREAVDCCASCWLLDLPILQPHGDTLEGLARYYTQCERTMDHWESLFPDRFARVRYERIIDSPREEVGRALAHVGVEWDDSCLRFYESGRRALTWSNDQVTQPLYRASLDRASRYGDRLDPLRAALRSK